MTHSSIRNGALGLIGAAAFVVDLRVDALATVAAAVLLAAVLWLILRRQAEQHRRTRRRRLRRQIGTAALVASGVWVVLALIRALRDGLSDGGDPVQAGGQLVDGPWPGTFLVAGVVGVAAIALVIAATVGGRRRHSTTDPTTPATSAARAVE